MEGKSISNPLQFQCILFITLFNLNSSISLFIAGVSTSTW
jgi:hypothetical protein